jgi:hypothetical protein
MDTGLIIVIAAVVLLVVALFGRRAWARSLEARREKAGELRVEATQREESARRAEQQAEKEREAAQARATRAERIDPDADGPRRRFRLFGRDRDDENEDADETDRVDTADDERPSLWDRLAHR